MVLWIIIGVFVPNDVARFTSDVVSLARANDARLKLKRNPASSACAMLGVLITSGPTLRAERRRHFMRVKRADYHAFQAAPAIGTICTAPSEFTGRIKCIVRVDF